MLISTNHLTSASWRKVFTVVATILFLYLGYISGRCYALFMRYRISVVKRVRLIDTLGWLRGWDVVLAPLTLRAIPGRLWYLLALYVFAGALSTQLFVTEIDPLSKLETGNYPMALVVDATTPEQVIGDTPSNTGGFLLAQQAQAWSKYNGDNTRSDQKCVTGIFKLAPLEPDEHFCPQESDVLGRWTCSVTYTKTYPGGSNDSIIADAEQNGWLDNVAHSGRSTWRNTDTKTSTYPITQLVVWTTTNTTFHSQWALKIAVQANADDKAPTMKYITCKVSKSPNATSTVDIIQGNVDSVHIINNWVLIIPGYIYTGFGSDASPDTTGILEGVLNSLFMVAGSMDRVVPTNGTVGYIRGYTNIPAPVWAFVSLTLLLCVLLTLTSAVLHVLLALRPGKVRGLPEDIVTWAAFAASTSKAKDLKKRNMILAADTPEVEPTSSMPEEQRSLTQHKEARVTIDQMD